MYSRFLSRMIASDNSWIRKLTANLQNGHTKHESTEKNVRLSSFGYARVSPSRSPVIMFRGRLLAKRKA